MNSESSRIADQLRRAFTGEAWHGPSLRELLDGVTAEQACARPLATGHNIWELVLHIDAYLQASFEAAEGGTMPKVYGTEKDWPAVVDSGGIAWHRAKRTLFEDAERLQRAIGEFADARLGDTVPGREYDFYRLFHGNVQHALYHGGQMGQLKKEATSEQVAPAGLA
ncbi:MAG TPA: DinB family protein [Bryobacteraceae bacterium]|nr:DinB family protein [Bryobacteraceae bacterium]